jgi:hypothetical protein
MRTKKMMNFTKPAMLVIISNVTCAVVAAPLTPVLDGYGYELYEDVIIDTENNIITIDSNMQNCQQMNGDPPLDLNLYALFNNNQFIGLKYFNYNTTTDTIFFTSESVDLICDNGVYVDTIYKGTFE